MIENIQPQQLIDFVGHTSAALAQANQKLEKLASVEQQQVKVAELIPAAVQEMIANKRIEPGSKSAAEAALADPVKAMQILFKLASHRNEKEIAALGKPVEPEFGKGASFSPIGSPRSDMRESDRALWSGLGLPIPD